MSRLIASETDDFGGGICVRTGGRRIGLACVGFGVAVAFLATPVGGRLIALARLLGGGIARLVTFIGPGAASSSHGSRGLSRHYSVHEDSKVFNPFSGIV